MEASEESEGNFVIDMLLLSWHLLKTNLLKVASDELISQKLVYILNLLSSFIINCKQNSTEYYKNSSHLMHIFVIISQL